MKRTFTKYPSGYVRASTDEPLLSNGRHVSQLSFDFIGNVDYDVLCSIVEAALKNQNCIMIGANLEGVDYSGYPEYRDADVAQFGCDYVWKEPYSGDDDILESEIRSRLSDLGVDIIGFGNQWESVEHAYKSWKKSDIGGYEDWGI